MTRTAMLAAAALCLGAGGALAALPPIHDRVGQFRAVLATDGLAEALSGYGLIDRIERVDDLVYRVWTHECFVDVRLEPLPPAGGLVGPVGYDGHLGEVSCR